VQTRSADGRPRVGGQRDGRDHHSQRLRDGWLWTEDFGALAGEEIGIEIADERVRLAPKPASLLSAKTPRSGADTVRYESFVARGHAASPARGIAARTALVDGSNIVRAGIISWPGQGWPGVFCRVVEHDRTNISGHEAVLGHISGQCNNIQVFDHGGMLNQAQHALKLRRARAAGRSGG
jgi:hypothetical protein